MTGVQTCALPISSAARDRTTETLLLLRELTARRMRCSGVIVNRVHLGCQDDNLRTQLHSALQVPADRIEAVEAALREEDLIARTEQNNVRTMQQAAPQIPLWLQVPMLPRDVHDLDAISHIVNALAGESLIRFV